MRFLMFKRRCKTLIAFPDQFWQNSLRKFYTTLDRILWQKHCFSALQNLLLKKSLSPSFNVLVLRLLGSHEQEQHWLLAEEEIVRFSHNFCPGLKDRTLEKKIPVVRYFTWKLELVSNILWVFFSGNIFLIATRRRPPQT